MLEPNQRVRVQLDMTAGEARRLDDLIDECDLRSRSDAVRAALAVIDWVSKETQAGRKVVALGDGVAAELVMPGVTSQIGHHREPQ